MIKQRVHFVDNYFLNPLHPITVNVIGAGGTGAQVVTNLARLDVTLRALGHPGLHVTVYDPDTVSLPNVGRQLFSVSDVGLNKAQCLVTRINRCMGIAWQAEPEKYPEKIKKLVREDIANITITCTDNIKSRVFIGEIFQVLKKYNYYDNYTPFYWMDFGNTKSTGQVLLGTVYDIKQPQSELYETESKLKVITEFVDYKNVKEEDSGPSCSLAEALEKQDLFINSTLANLGCTILWKLFKNGFISYHGLFLNLDTMKVNPILI